MALHRPSESSKQPEMRTVYVPAKRRVRLSTRASSPHRLAISAPLGSKTLIRAGSQAAPSSTVWTVTTSPAAASSSQSS